MAPLTILIHELAHLVVPIAFGLSAELHPASVSGGAKLGSAASWLVALQVGAGPLATIIISVVAARLYARDRSRVWALAAAIASAARLLVTTAYLGIRLLLLVQGQRFTGTPNFDEHQLAAALGLPTLLVAGAATAFLFGLIYWLFRRIPPGRRLLFALAVVVGIAVGIILWQAVAPETLLTIPAR